MSLKDLVHKVHDLAYENEDSNAKEVVPVVLSVSTVQQYQTAPIRHDATLIVDAEDLKGTEANDWYTRLAAATDVSQAGSLKKLIEREAPLESVISDPILRLKAACAQLKATDGISVLDLAVDLDKIIDMLAGEKNKFDAAVARRIEDFSISEKKASDLEAQAHDLRVQVLDGRSKLDRSKMEFTQALTRRKGELDRQKQEFESIKGQ